MFSVFILSLFTLIAVPMFYFYFRGYHREMKEAKYTMTAMIITYLGAAMIIVAGISFTYALVKGFTQILENIN